MEENDEQPDIYFMIRAWLLTDAGRLPRLIEKAREVLRENFGRELTVFDSDTVSNAILAMIFDGAMLYFIKRLNYPSVDFKRVHEEIKYILQQFLRRQQVSNASNES